MNIGAVSQPYGFNYSKTHKKTNYLEAFSLFSQWDSFEN